MYCSGVLVTPVLRMFQALGWKVRRFNNFRTFQPSNLPTHYGLKIALQPANPKVFFNRVKSVVLTTSLLLKSALAS